MQKQKKVVFIILGILIVGGFTIYSGSAELFQGRMFTNSKPLPAYNESRCYDSDSGKNYEEKGTIYGKLGVRSGFGNRTDECVTKTKLREYYCDGNTVKKEEKECGKCIDSKCDTEYCNQTKFKTAFIVLVKDPGDATEEILDQANFYREQTSITFAEATNNLASMDTSAELFLMETDDAMFDELNKLTHQEIITNNFYETNSDDYDFIIVLTTFDSNGAPSNYMGVTSQIEGIGIPPGDSTLSMGSKGQLKGVVMLYDWNSFPLQYPHLTSVQINIILHEIGHHWGVYVGDGFTGDGSEKLGVVDDWGEIHFYGGLESPDKTGSPMYANYFIPNGDGTFKHANETGVKKYHPFMLYFMGLLPENEYSAKYQIYDQGPGGANAYNATPYKKVSVNDIIAVEGERKCQLTK